MENKSCVIDEIQIQINFLCGRIVYLKKPT